MVVGSAEHDYASAAPERRLPPVGVIAVASMSLIILGGISIAAYVPRTVPLGPPIGLLAGAGVLLVADVVILSRLHPFGWHRFFQVFRWALLAYVVTAGMIGYVFLVDGTRGRLLILLISMLLIYAVDIPLLLAFSVARYEDVTSS